MLLFNLLNLILIYRSYLSILLFTISIFLFLSSIFYLISLFILLSFIDLIYRIDLISCCLVWFSWVFRVLLWNLQWNFSLIICKNFAQLIVRLAVSLGTTERKELDRVSPSWIGFWFGSMACTVWTRADFPERTNANAHGAAAETEMARGAAAGRAAAQSVEWSRRPVPQSLLNSPQLINVLLCFVKHTHPKKKNKQKERKKPERTKPIGWFCRKRRHELR